MSMAPMEAPFYFLDSNIYGDVHFALAIIFIFHFVRSGGVYLNKAALRYTGRVGHDWGNTPAAFESELKANAYFLDYDPETVVSPSWGPYDRHYALSIRCLVY